MCIHEPIKRIVCAIVSKLIAVPTDILRDNLAWSILCLIIVILICIPVIEIINRKMKWMIGKF